MNKYPSDEWIGGWPGGGNEQLMNELMPGIWMNRRMERWMKLTME